MEGPRTIGFWGRTGSTKSSQLLALAEDCWNRFRLQTRYIVFGDDNAVSTVESSGLIEAGAIDLLDVTGMYSNAMAVSFWLQGGYWYRTNSNGDKLIAKKPEFLTLPEEWAKIGQVCVEGGTGMGECFRRQISTSKDKVAWGKPWMYETPDGDVVGGVAEQHIGMIQQRVIDFVAGCKQSLWAGNSVKTPLKRFIMTFHDGYGNRGKAGKVEAGEVVFGPKIDGQAATASLGKYFNDLIHLCKEDTEIEVLDEKGVTIGNKKEKRVWAYFQEHNDSGINGTPCLAAIRVPSKFYPKLLAKWPNGGLMLDYEMGILPFYQALEKLEKFAREQNMKAAQSFSEKEEKKG